MHLFRIAANGLKCRVCFSTSVPTIPNCNFPQPEYKGISYSDALRIRSENIPSFLKLYYKEPVMITRGYMQYVWDENGRCYLDMFGGIVTVSAGHCHPKIVNAAVSQINKLWHVTNIYLHPKLHEYAEKLTSHFPNDLKVCYFCNSGSEANDIALLLARVYTGAFDIIALRNSYHGNSPYNAGLCGISSWKQPLANGFGIHHAMNPDPYRGIWGGHNCRDSLAQTDRKCNCSTGSCEASEKYIGCLEELLNSSVPNKVAGFFAESIQGVGGTVQFTKGYLKKAYDVIKQRGGVFIMDEVQTGFGRTGQYWGFESHDIVPDIVTLAKGIGNGFPLAAVVTKHEIADSINNALVFNTFGGNPVACAVGSAVLDVIDEENLMENSKDVGNYLLSCLTKLKSHEIVGDIRGKGLMIGVELVTDKETQKHLPKDDMDIIFEDTKKMGLLIGRGGSKGNVFRIKPPMCITRDDADFCVTVLDQAIAKFCMEKT